MMDRSPMGAPSPGAPGSAPALLDAGAEPCAPLENREPLEIHCDGIIYLLRHLGPHTDSELRDSLAITFPDLVEATSSLHVAGRIERHGRDRWRLAAAADTDPRAKRKRRRDLAAHQARQVRHLYNRHL